MAERTRLERLAERGARFGIAVGTMGLEVQHFMPFMLAFAPELETRFGVRIGSDLTQISLVTRGDPSSVDFVRRVTEQAAAVSPDLARSFGHILAGAGGPALIEATLSADGVALSLSRVLGRGLADELQALTQGPSPRFPVSVAAGLLDRGLLLRPVCDEIADMARDGSRVTRVGFAMPSAAAARVAIDKMVEVTEVTERQRVLFAGLYDILTRAAGVVVVRLSASSDGVLPELGIEYRVVAAENVLKVWQAVCQNTQISSKMGAFVGATGMEIASAFEVRWSAGEPAACDALFDLGEAPCLLGIARVSS